MKKKILVAIALLICGNAIAQQSVNTIRTGVLSPYQPTRTEMLQRYKDMMLLDSTARNAVFKMRVNANWLAGGNSFWYSNALKNDEVEYVYVDAAKGVKQAAFDHTRLAAALAATSGEKVAANKCD